MRHRFQIAWFAAFAAFASPAEAATDALIVQCRKSRCGSSTARRGLRGICSEGQHRNCSCGGRPCRAASLFLCAPGASPTAPKTAELKR